MLINFTILTELDTNSEIATCKICHLTVVLDSTSYAYGYTLVYVPVLVMSLRIIILGTFFSQLIACMYGMSKHTCVDALVGSRQSTNLHTIILGWLRQYHPFDNTKHKYTLMFYL